MINDKQHEVPRFISNNDIKERIKKLQEGGGSDVGSSTNREAKKDGLQQEAGWDSKAR